MAESKRPNFLIIVADDLGFSDLSSFGSEIQTPHIDSLSSPSTQHPSSTTASASTTNSLGLRFTSFHVAAACSPTRSMLMTGVDHHLTGLGQLSEYTRNSPPHQGAPGHEGFLNQKVVTLPEILREGNVAQGGGHDGYWTVMSGKWHLGLKRETSPWARGFDKSFALLPGCANHYGYEPSYKDPNTEPPRFFETAVTALHREDADCFPCSSLPADFYSSDFYATKLIDYFSKRTSSEEEKPFFAYLPFSAPHWPLQAPEESVKPYTGMYDDGPDALRLRRLSRLKELGIVPADVVPHSVVTSSGEPAKWSSMSSSERAKSARSMEVYAGMVSRMDDNVGRVLEYLKSTKEYDNTYIFFMSDNGAEGASYEAHPIMGDNIVQHIENYYDNSLDNIGRKDSFVWYGVRWAQAATAPSRLYKMFSTQGGCRVPLIVKPAAAEGIRTDIIARAGITDSFCTVMDIVPTILELAGLQHPGSQYKGRDVLSLMGKSWVPFLANAADQGQPPTNPLAIHGEEQAIGWEIAGSGALRKGRYKITYVPFPKGPQKWELFDILDDPGETQDVSEANPIIFKEMLQAWDIYKEKVGVVGLAGQYKCDGSAYQKLPVDEFEDSGQWIRFMGKSDIPEKFRASVPV